MRDIGTMVGQALEVLPIPFLVLEPVRDEATDRQDLMVVWANGPARERFGTALEGSWLDRDAPFGTMESVVPETLLSRTSPRLRVVERAVDHEGRIQHLRYTLIPVEDGAAMMVEDITSEIEVRAELAVAGTTLAHVQRWGNLGVWELDLVSGSTYWSTQLHEILAIEEPGIDSFLSVVHPDDRPLVEHALQRATEQAGPYRLTHRILRRDEIRTVDQHMQSVSDATGRPTRLIGTMIDVTATSALQQQVHQTQQLRTMGVLAGGLAHDFNNVLLVIRGHADVLLRQADADDPARPSLEAISRAGTRASTLTRKLMSLGRQDDLRATRIDPEGLLHDVVELVRPAVDHGVRIDAETELAGSIELLADVDHLRQVLLDLVFNARDAGSRHIRIRVEDHHLDHDDPRCGDADVPAGHYGIIRVIDDGSGMTHETQQRMFEPFFTTKESHAGSGLGLSNARAFAERSLGALLVDSTPGEGTTMSVLLPASVPADLAAPAYRRRPRPTRILLATTDPHRSDHLSAVLDTLGHQVVCVTDLDAMAFSLETEPIDLVVLGDDLLTADTWPRVLSGVTVVVLTDRPRSFADAARTVSLDDHLALEHAVAELLGPQASARDQPGGPDATKLRAQLS